MSYCEIIPKCVVCGKPIYYIKSRGNSRKYHPGCWLLFFEHYRCITKRLTRRAHQLAILAASKEFKEKNIDRIFEQLRDAEDMKREQDAAKEGE